MNYMANSKSIVYTSMIKKKHVQLIATSIIIDNCGKKYQRHLKRDCSEKSLQRRGSRT